jgi:hypothetical protein
MDSTPNTPPPAPKFTITVTRNFSGVWAEDEYKEVGRDEENNAKYGNVPVSKWREKKIEIFRFESDVEPDALKLTRLLKAK